MANKKLIYSLLFLLAGAIIALVVLDNRSTRPDKRPDNPYEYDIKEYMEVDPGLIIYTETSNIRLGSDIPRGISWFGGRIYLVTENSLQVISPEGRQLSKTALPEAANTVHAAEPGIFVAFDNRVVQYGFDGSLVREFVSTGDSTHFTSLAFSDGVLAVADAGKRVVLLFREDGTLIRQISGKRESEDLHGFIIPSPFFDLAYCPVGELWVVNPGLHAFENYSRDGNLRGHWAVTSMKIDGFSGCCNPAHMAILPDGHFATSEKGLVRIKVYKPSGELLGVVAPPASFKPGETAPDLAVTAAGEVLALDFDRKMIRIFEKKNQDGS
ncbi:MAG: hypothetical protein R6V75_01365 [Bacteroidales bacterium]